ncbi:MAG: ribonuclease R [Flavobacteriales bacterium]|nr:ribonuclease R [Flavobacteriales bacterium]
MSHKRKKNKPVSKGKLINSVLVVFEKNQGRTLNYKQIARALNITSANSRKVIIDILNDLVVSEKLKEVDHGKYELKATSRILSGPIEFTRSGSGFVTIEGQNRDIYIHARNARNALNGDVVEVRITKSGQGGRRSEGKVVSVTERAKTKFVGQLEVSQKYAFVIPNDDKTPVDFFVPLDKLNGAKHGEIVLVKMTSWSADQKSPHGEISEVFGNPEDNNVEMKSILANKGFTTGFQRVVEREAEKIPLEISKEEIAKRKDFRDVLTFTIDPADAKDFDDALSFKKLKNGTVEVGVHIADVTHYITPGSALDEEAINRATSVYLVDRVIPMLPERLSNGVCSLRPNEEKLCFAAVFEIDKDAKIISTWIGRTIIYSDKRFTYEDVQEIIEAGAGLYVDEILHLNSLAKTLRNNRMNDGSISFDRVEVRIKLDEHGEPDGIYLKEQKDAHKLIEDFMLLANRSVALYVSKLERKDKTFVYRIHDDPDPDKISAFGQFISRFGYKIDENRVQSSLNSVLSAVKGKPEANVVETLAIRTMAKAVYTTKNIGHYGLGFSHYSHFTSPIRRYPDVLTHRLLWYYLTGEGEKIDPEEIEELCKHCSQQERSAVEAERESTKYFQALMLNDKVGETFSGLISGVTDFGFFVEIEENKCEGLIRLADMQDDHYYFDEKNFQVVGNNHGAIYQIGQRVMIKVRKVNLMKKQIDFELVLNLT